MDMPKGFVWGPINAEDIALVGSSPWLITSGMLGATVLQGRLFVVDVRDRSCSEVFPYRASFAPDEMRFCAPALDPQVFQPHSLDVVTRADGVSELYVVNHGSRQSVEVFEIVDEGLRPSLRWIGAVELPAPARGNSVAAIPGGGFVVSYNIVAEVEHALEPEEAGIETGGAYEWSPERGLTLLPESTITSANGIAVSPDGTWVYLSGWRSRCLKKIRRAGGPVESRVVGLPILTDNLTWTQEGNLLAAGVFDTPAEEFMRRIHRPDPRLLLPSRVLRLDPDTLAVEVAVEYAAGAFGAATVGLQVGEEIWVGSARDSGLARFGVRS